MLRFTNSTSSTKAPCHIPTAPLPYIYHRHHKTGLNRTEHNSSGQLRTEHTRTSLCANQKFLNKSADIMVLSYKSAMPDVLHRLDEGSPIDMAPAVRDEEADPATRPCVVYGMVEGTGLAHASFAWEKSVWRRVMAVRSEREFGRHVYYGVLVYVSYL